MKHNNNKYFKFGFTVVFGERDLCTAFMFSMLPNAAMKPCKLASHLHLKHAVLLRIHWLYLKDYCNRWKDKMFTLFNSNWNLTCWTFKWRRCQLMKVTVSDRYLVFILGIKSEKSAINKQFVKLSILESMKKFWVLKLFINFRLLYLFTYAFRECY